MSSISYVPEVAVREYPASRIRNLVLFNLAHIYPELFPGSETAERRS